MELSLEFGFLFNRVLWIFLLPAFVLEVPQIRTTQEQVFLAPSPLFDIQMSQKRMGAVTNTHNKCKSETIPATATTQQRQQQQKRQQQRQQQQRQQQQRQFAS